MHIQLLVFLWPFVLISSNLDYHGLQNTPLLIYAQKVLLLRQWHAVVCKMYFVTDVQNYEKNCSLWMKHKQVISGPMHSPCYLEVSLPLWCHTQLVICVRELFFSYNWIFLTIIQLFPMQNYLPSLVIRYFWLLDFLIYHTVISKLSEILQLLTGIETHGFCPDNAALRHCNSSLQWVADRPYSCWLSWWIGGVPFSLLTCAIYYQEMDVPWNWSWRRTSKENSAFQ